MTGLRLCNHTKSDGSTCLAPALGRSRLCRHHHRQAGRTHRRTLALHPGRTVHLGQLDSRSTIQRALNRVIQLLAAGTLPEERAGHALYRINVALAAINRSKDTTADAVIPSEAAKRCNRGTLAPTHPQSVETNIEHLLNAFTAAFNPLTMQLEFAPTSTVISHLANPLEPRTLNLEPGTPDLPSPPTAPTIVETPAIRRSSPPAVNHHPYPNAERPHRRT